TVTINNTGLLPTYSRNIDVQAELYTKSAGTVTVGWFKKTVTNYIINDRVPVSAANDELFDGLYGDYDLITQDNGGTGQFEGLEISVRQSLRPYLKFAPDLLQGWEVFGGYKKNYKGEAPTWPGMLTKPLGPNFYDWNGYWGLSYMTPRRFLYLNVRTTIFPQAITTAATTTDLRPVYESRHQRWDATVRLQFNPTYSLE